MVKRIAALAAFALVLAPLGASAGSSTPARLPDMMNPGLWEMTVQMQMSGVPMQLPSHTYRHCVTKADLEKNHGVPKPENTKDMTCTMKKFDRSGNTLTYTMECTGTHGTMTLDGASTFESRDAYHGTMHMTGTVEGRQMDMTSKVQAKRVGDCSQ